MINFKLILILFSTVSYFNLFATLNMNEPYKYDKPLYDIGYEVLPQISLKIPNAILILYVIYAILRFVRFDNFDITKKFLLSMTIIFFIRIWCFTTTIVPPPIYPCDFRKPGEPIRWNVLKYLSHDSDNTCTDMLFSGHAAYATLITLLVYQYSQFKLEKILASIYYLICILTVISGRLHYTCDVVVGIAITILVHNIIFIKNNIN